MILVGTYSEEQINAGQDKIDVEKAKKETGLQYVESKIVRRKGEYYLRLWVCTAEEMSLGMPSNAEMDMLLSDPEFVKIMEQVEL